VLSELNRGASILRDIFNDSFTSILIDDETLYLQIKNYVQEIAPKKENIVKFYDSNVPIFEKFGIERQIKTSFGKTVSGSKGTYLVIEHTEALHVIDVNSGKRSNKSKNQEDTALEVNLIAASDVARQLRLRDMGGIIVIDFIDMERERNREKVYQATVEAMANDKAQTRISRISDLGLIEISRERVREDLLRTLSEICNECEGRGYTKSTMTVAYEIFRDIRRIGNTRGQGQRIVVGANPTVIELLFDTEHSSIEQLEQEFQQQVLFKADPLLHLEQYDIVVVGKVGQRAESRAAS